MFWRKGEYIHQIVSCTILQQRPLWLHYCKQSHDCQPLFSLLNFWRTKVLLWGHWYSYYWLLVTSALDFKPLLTFFVTCVQLIPQAHLWCDTCWPLGGQHCSWAVLICVDLFGYQIWWDSNMSSSCFSWRVEQVVLLVSNADWSCGKHHFICGENTF